MKVGLGPYPETLTIENSGGKVLAERAIDDSYVRSHWVDDNTVVLTIGGDAREELPFNATTYGN